LNCDAGYGLGLGGNRNAAAMSVHYPTGNAQT
jgi:hypothetical protein